MLQCLRKVRICVAIIAQLHVCETAIEVVVAIMTGTASKSTIEVLQSLSELSQFIIGLSCVAEVLR